MTDDKQDREAIRGEAGIGVVKEDGMIVTEDPTLGIWPEKDPFRQTDKEIEMIDNEQDPEVIKEETEMTAEKGEILTEEVTIETGEEKGQDPIIVEKLTEKFLTPRSRLVLIKPSRKSCYVLLRVWTAPMEVK